MLHAAGPHSHNLCKEGVALASTKTAGNTREAAIDCTGDGQWRLRRPWTFDLPIAAGSRLCLFSCIRRLAPNSLELMRPLA
jgi:hypothetical protein